MCRWFAYISPIEPCLLSDVLITPANAISKQCSEHYLPGLLPQGQEKELDDAKDDLVRMRNSLLNMDGLGIAWYTDAMASYLKNIDGSRPALYKSQSPPSNDFNFRSLCFNTETYCVFAHIRAATGSVVSPVNSHPFAFGRHIFMHNGVVSQFTSIRRKVCDLLADDAYANVLGSTDSEHAAALYMTNLTNHGHVGSWNDEYPLQVMLDALIKTIVQIMELQQETFGSEKSPNSLNFCTTDGKKMVACRFRNHATQHPPSLYWSEFAGRTLNQKFPGHPDGPTQQNDQASKGEDERIGKHTIISSEPTTYDSNEWHLINRNCALTVDEFGTESEVPIDYDPALDSQNSGSGLPG